jgi:hypothetical protein
VEVIVMRFKSRVWCSAFAALCLWGAAALPQAAHAAVKVTVLEQGSRATMLRIEVDKPVLQSVTRRPGGSSALRKTALATCWVASTTVACRSCR